MTTEDSSGIARPAVGTTQDFSYSDGGEVEARMLSIVSRASDLSCGSMELRRAITDWPTLIHFGPQRANLLRPFERILRGRILEVGSGCGAITRFLGECGAQVTAVDGSEIRCAINRQRCRDLANVAVHCANYNDWRADGDFDAVVCVGFLEYGRVYSKSPDAIVDLLGRFSSQLKPGGVLLLAIENQLGLKYFAGAPEDHAGEPFFGINGRYTSDSFVTFGARELEHLLKATGFPELDWYYPFPDYKLPHLILHSSALRERALDVAALVRRCSAPNQAHRYTRVFSEEMAWEAVARNGLTGELANSFLIAARKNPALRSGAVPLAYIYSTHRQPYFAKTATIERKKGRLVVRRRPLHDVPPPEGCGYRRRILDEELISGPILMDRIYPLLNTPGWAPARIAEWAAPWLEYLRAHMVEDASDGSCLPPDFVDCTPFNLIEERPGELRAFDLEYLAGAPVPLDFVVFRGLWESIARTRTCAEPAEGVSRRVLDIVAETMRAMGLAVDRERLTGLISFETELQEAVQGASREQLVSAYETLEIEVRTPPPPLVLPGGEFTCQAYWSLDGGGFRESDSAAASAVQAVSLQRAEIPVPAVAGRMDALRLDIANRPGIVRIYDIRVRDNREGTLWVWDPARDDLGAMPRQQVDVLAARDGAPGTTVFLSGEDPFVILPIPAETLGRFQNGGVVEVSLTWPVAHQYLDDVLGGVVALNERIAVLERWLGDEQQQSARLAGLLAAEQAAAKTAAEAAAAAQAETQAALAQAQAATRAALAEAQASTQSGLAQVQAATQALESRVTELRAWLESRAATDVVAVQSGIAQLDEASRALAAQLAALGAGQEQSAAVHAQAMREAMARVGDSARALQSQLAEWRASQERQAASHASALQAGIEQQAAAAESLATRIAELRAWQEEEAARQSAETVRALELRVTQLEETFHAMLARELEQSRAHQLRIEELIRQASWRSIPPVRWLLRVLGRETPSA